MATIPSYDQWIRDTSSFTSPRSDFLKKVDEALKKYDLAKNQLNRDALKAALDRWRFEQSKQGKDWTKSVRNSKGAVTNLYRALQDVDKRKLTPEEIEAMKYISHAQALALAKMFDGKQLRFKPSTLVGVAQGAGSKFERFKTGAGSAITAASTAKKLHSGVQNVQKGVALLHQGGKAAVMNADKAQIAKDVSGITTKIKEFCKELCPGIDPNHVFTALHLGQVETFASSVAPFVGAISSGGKAVIGWIGVAKSAYSTHAMAGLRYAFAPVDPEAAFDALSEVMERDLASKTAKASVSTVAFTGKILGAFADYGAVTGPVIGMMELLAEIFQAIVEYVRDFMECKRANELLRIGALNLEIFQASPILGCYFLVVQDHSTIINFAVGEYGTPNWMFDVEQLVKKINKALEKSRDLIRENRLEIPEFANYKGVVEQSYSVKHGLSAVTGAPGALKDKIGDTIAGWFSNPTKPELPTFDKSRIYGISYKDKV